jgi:hypothetical protein
MEIKSKDEARFFSKVDSTEIEGCHPWIACTTQDGYGLFRINGTLTTAHRVSYEITVGPIPEGMVVRHSNECTTRGCVNPNHLSTGTQVDNMRDRDEAGRTPKGESSGASKLKTVGVLDIRKRAAAGETQASIAKDYQVETSTISAIVRRKTWRHI